jgi:1-deoxy-D-xylulose-5-phosphate reductoisomerase
VKGVCILGSTGTVGVNTLDVLSRNRERFNLVALSANCNVDAMLGQCIEWEPRFAVMASPDAAQRLHEQLVARGLDIEVLAGTEGLETVAAHESVDYVMAGIVGAAGLLPTLAAARAGKRVLLANKEALVMSGRLFMDAVRDNGAELVPIDSEHNAIFQCMPGPVGGSNGIDCGVQRILLTGSGGPFRSVPLEQLHDVSPDEACAHPNWVMGRKISVDSATMMNKGLEVIEACWLFDMATDRIEVVIHPQSIIHSMVQYVDGSVLAQLGQPDMRTPIAHAMAWPERIASGVERLDFTKLTGLDFEAPDYDRLPCLRLGYEAAQAGGTTPTVLNAANEIAVDAFLCGQMRFTDIPRVIETTLADISRQDATTLETVLDVDATARARARECIDAITGVARQLS